MNLTKINKKRILVCFAIILISLVSAIIQMKIFWPKGTVLGGDDIGFHLNRAFGLAEAIKTHHYPFYINDILLNGYGYAENWFYPNLFLFPMAILLNTGYSLAVSYKAYIIFYTVITVCVTYYCIHKMSKRMYLSACTAILYTFSLYRAFDVYQRAALGEALAFIFFPVILYGTYEILYGNKKKWYVLAIGFTGMLYSHVLSSVLAFIMLLLLLLFSINKLWEDKTKMLYFILAGGVTVLLSAFFIFPMIEQMQSNTFYFNTNVLTNTYDQAYTFEQIWRSIISDYKGSVIIGLGYTLFFPLIFRFTVKEKNDMIRFADKCLLITVILLFMTTKYFPWESLPILNVIQFPFRLYTIISLLLAFSGVVYMSYSIRKKFYKIILLFILLASSIGNAWTIAQPYKDFRMQDGNIKFKGNETYENSYDIGAGLEYLPSVANIDDLKSRGKEEVRKKNSSTKVSNLSKENNELSLDFDTKSKDILELPMVYYKGYQAKVNGQNVPIKMSKNGLIEVEIQGKGTLEISYPGTVIQKVSYYTSITVFIILMAFITFVNIRNNKRKPNYDENRNVII
ncbi:hypothetical protein COE51_13245 [Bacillus pseudomycoides]|nr:hypothetical protein COE51_13245 [Bacillus pseudomycoides]